MFDFLQSYFSEHRKFPLIREVQAGCEISSYKSALDRLNALERKGYIKRTPNKHRGIRIVRHAAASPLPVKATPLETAGERTAV